MAAAIVTAPNPRTVERYDLAGKLGKFARTPSGGLTIPAWISRTGVQAYENANGQVVREFRPPTEVFDEASYRSFEGAPVTVDHPKDLVNPMTWRAHAVGTVRNVRPDGDRLAADLVIEDGETIAAIESGELVETSAGYHAAVAPVAGMHDGETYEATQQAIRGNHVALGPEGWGRAGPSVRLRVDAAHQITDAPERVLRSDSMTAKRMVKIDGYEFEAGSEQHLSAVERERGKLTQELADAVKRADAADVKAASLAAELANVRADAKNVDVGALVDARIALLDKARKILGDGYEHAGKTDREIMVDALGKAGTKIAEDADDAFIAGAFSVATNAAKGDMDEEEPDGDEPPPEDDEETDGRGDSRGFTATRPRGDGGAKPAPYRMPSLADKWRS